MDTRLVGRSLDGVLLAKRGCVSDCVVPSCSSLSCKATETCILSAQTCDACPVVSCVSLAFTDTTFAARQQTIPKGAIAGIVIASVVLLVGIVFLALKIRQRRRTLWHNHEKAFATYQQDLEQHNDYFDKPSRMSDLASITIGIEEDLANPLPLPSPLSPGDHFFSADELLRMSYAESSHSPAKPDASANDEEAAIMQSTGSVTAMRAKVEVMQFSRTGTITSHNGRGSPVPAQAELRLQPTSTTTHNTSGSQPLSVWEDDNVSVMSSPVETELISSERFYNASMRNSVTSTGEATSSHFSNKTLRLLTRSPSASSRASRSPRVGTPLRQRDSATDYDWQDPELLPSGDGRHDRQ